MLITYYYILLILLPSILWDRPPDRPHYHVAFRSRQLLLLPRPRATYQKIFTFPLVRVLLRDNRDSLCPVVVDVVVTAPTTITTAFTAAAVVRNRPAHVRCGESFVHVVVSAVRFSIPAESSSIRRRKRKENERENTIHSDRGQHAEFSRRTSRSVIMSTVSAQNDRTYFPALPA